MRPTLPLLSLLVLMIACASPEDEIGSFSGGTSALGGSATGGSTTSGGTTTTGGSAGTGGTVGSGATPASGGSSLGSCTDGEKNGLETDLDCGGTCDPCAAGASCTNPSDCQSNLCEGGICSHCGDGIVNGDEADVDCGGACGGCVGDACSDAAPCSEAFVCDAAGLCSTCGNRVQDGDETGKDCGGSCLLCTGAPCTSPDECLSGDCPDGTCAAASCVEGWETVTGSGMCANAQSGADEYQDDRAGCADILDCLIANAAQCETFSACVMTNPNQGSTCEFEQQPSRQYAEATWNEMCQ